MWIWGWVLGCHSDTPDWSARFTDDPTAGENSVAVNDGSCSTFTHSESITVRVSWASNRLVYSLRRHCTELLFGKRKKRPHLWMPLKEQNVSVTETVQLSSGDCTDVACRIERAMSDALRGNIESVQRICQGSSNSETHECLFMLAETIVSNRGVAKYDTAASICGLAKSFHGKLSESFDSTTGTIVSTEMAPDADSTSDWSDIMTAHNALETSAWGWRDSGLKSRLQSRLWSEALGFAFAGSIRLLVMCWTLYRPSTMLMYAVLRLGAYFKWKNPLKKIWMSGLNICN